MTTPEPEQVPQEERPKLTEEELRAKWAARPEPVRRRARES